VKREPLRRLLSNAWQAFEFLDQTRERFGEIRHRVVYLKSAKGAGRSAKRHRNRVAPRSALRVFLK